MTRDEYTWWCDLGVAVHRLVDMIEAGLLFESEVFMKRVQSYYPVTITIDGDPVNLQIKRLSPTETDALETKMQEYGVSLDGKQVTSLVGEVRKEAALWLETTIRDYVNVAPGQLEVETADGVSEVLTGLGLITLYGGRVDVIAQVLALVWGENKLPTEHKDTYRAGMREQFVFTPKVETPVSEPTAPARKPRRVVTQNSLIDASEPATTGAETS